MFVHIHIHTSYAWASTLRSVDCCYCHTPYLYAIRCRGIGSSGSAYGIGAAAANKAAQGRAIRKLDRSLDHSIEAVPCPNCHRLQPDMIRMRRWKAIARVLGFWGIVAGHGALIGLLALDPAFPKALNYALIVVPASTLLALPLIAVAWFAAHRVQLPPHFRVITRLQADAEGYASLILPYVYPDGGIHVYPSALCFPAYCARCNAPATKMRVKRLKYVGVALPFCTPCRNRSVLLQAIASAIVFLVFACGLVSPIVIKGHEHNAMPAILAGIFAGIVATVVAWFAIIRHAAFPVRFRRHDSLRDSTILHCRNRDFAESVLAHLLQFPSPIAVTQIVDPEALAVPHIVPSSMEVSAPALA